MLALDDLKKYKDEILKAEIGAILFNLGKTHIGFWKEKKDKNNCSIQYFKIDEQNFELNFGYKVFKNYKDYYKNNQSAPFEIDLNKFTRLKGFILGQNQKIQKVKLPFKVKIDNQQENKEIFWHEFFKGECSKVYFIKKVFFRGCENVNSGIDKGSPVEQLKPPLWLSNAFGSYKYKLDEKDFDHARLTFLSDLKCFLQRNNYYQTPDWKEIRKFVFEKVKPWYSRLLSDSRYPVNDVSLWDQAYMTASMFKAVLANMILENSKVQNYQNNPTSIRWRILGIQYDKLGLAEEGFKPAHIKWYRYVSKEIDDKIKELLEYEYPIGNEVYRDETGIYFIVGEDLGNDLSDSSLAVLKNDLLEIKDKILDIFKEKSSDEFYPSIFLTKASRGLMNLTYLLEKARENFLKADWSQKDSNICIKKSSGGRAVGICQVCKQRLVFERYKKDENRNICENCDIKKTQGRDYNWFNDRGGETIWTGELKDEKGRIALVVMKFELMDWLNGNLLNSEIVRKDVDYEDYLEKTKDVIKYINDEVNKDEVKNLRDIDNNLESKIKSFLSLYDKEGIYKPFEEIYSNIKQYKNLNRECPNFCVNGIGEYFSYCF